MYKFYSDCGFQQADNIGITSHCTRSNSIMCSDSYPIPILSLFFLYHPYIPYFLINPRRACAARVTVVAVCVCVSVKSHLTSGASVRPENAVTYSTGNEGQKICGVFSKTHAFRRSSAPSLGWPYIRSAIFPADNTHAHCA